MTTEYGPTDTGFIERFYSDIVAAKRANAIASFGSSIDLTNSSVFGQFINSLSYEEALIWQVIENTYYSRFIQYATGNALDDVVFAKGIFRKSGSKSTGEITITKQSTYNKRIFIATGTIVSDIDGLYPFVTTGDAVFPVDASFNTITIPVESVNMGNSYNVAAGKIAQLAQPIAGIISVSNAEATYGGNNRETDAELRLRAINYAPSSIGTRQSVINALLSITDVMGVNTKEYFTQTVVSYTTVDGVVLTSMPANSFIAFMIGANASNTSTIVQTLEDVRAYGILAHAVSAIPIDLNVSINCIYTSNAEQVADEIRTVVSNIVNEYGFGNTITYSQLLRAIGGLTDIDVITSLTFTIPSLSVTLSALGDSVNMGIDANRDKYLLVQTVTVNGS